MKKTKKPYGQVYAFAGTNHTYKIMRQFRGIIMDENHDERWIGEGRDDPENAFLDLVSPCERHGVEDIRRWSGVWPPEEPPKLVLDNGGVDILW